MLTSETAKALKKGTKLYNNILGPTYIAVVSGKPTFCMVNGWMIPVKRAYGSKTAGVITQNGYSVWRTEVEPSGEDVAVLRKLCAEPRRPSRAPVMPKREKEPVVVRREVVSTITARVRRVRPSSRTHKYAAEFEGQEVPVLRI